MGYAELSFVYGVSRLNAIGVVFFEVRVFCREIRFRSSVLGLLCRAVVFRFFYVLFLEC